MKLHEYYDIIDDVRLGNWDNLHITPNKGFSDEHSNSMLRTGLATTDHRT